MKMYHPQSRSAIWISALVAIPLAWGTHPGRASGDAANDVSTTIRPEAIRADMKFLADDLLEGLDVRFQCSLVLPLARQGARTLQHFDRLEGLFENEKLVGVAQPLEDVLPVVI